MSTIYGFPKDYWNIMNLYGQQGCLGVLKIAQLVLRGQDT